MSFWQTPTKYLFLGQPNTDIDNNSKCSYLGVPLTMINYMVFMGTELSGGGKVRN
jgi:hypothetical protein